MDNYGAVSNNPAIIYVMVKHNPNIGPTAGSSNAPPGTTINQPQQQQQNPLQSIIPNSNTAYTFTAKLPSTTNRLFQH